MNRNPGQEAASFTSVGRGGFFLLLAIISLLMIYVIWPFASAILWAVVAAIMFQPLYLSIRRMMGGHENRAAIATLLFIITAVLVPLYMIGRVVVEQATRIYLAIQVQQIDPAFAFAQLHDALPRRWRNMLDNSGLEDFNALQVKLSRLLEESVGLLGRQALELSGSALAFALALGVSLYIAYFLLRDGQRIGSAVCKALPLERPVADRLAGEFVTIVRATIKGSVVVGLAQGALGAITFWIVGVPAALFFGVLMAILSLLPAIGPPVIWIPVAIYLFVVGDFWQAIAVIISGVALIGLVDNLLRPILVGRDTGIPDWMVLVTTLGGIVLFGLAGIVVGPVVAGLFLAAWSVSREQRDEAPPVELVDAEI
ncbi:AI-2E family transporter [Croceicoccus sp. F390]|uniref:AI-2E family transporter n=1 Tax=Croceicoccus esteveae TaxID=3075597 RepID=A0ABU2ZGT6_9SPHN|nr:AI-2E family transporter [Croceicoccus sp. F390]MDT0575610.1 AI-2E family transporter [Croceicoccus sp. F390]